MSCQQQHKFMSLFYECAAELDVYIFGFVNVTFCKNEESKDFKIYIEVKQGVVYEPNLKLKQMKH